MANKDNVRILNNEHYNKKESKKKVLNKKKQLFFQENPISYTQDTLFMTELMQNCVKYDIKLLINDLETIRNLSYKLLAYKKENIIKELFINFTNTIDTLAKGYKIEHGLVIKIFVNIIAKFFKKQEIVSSEIFETIPQWKEITLMASKMKNEKQKKESLKQIFKTILNDVKNN